MDDAPIQERRPRLSVEEIIGFAFILGGIAGCAIGVIGVIVLIWIGF